MLKMLANTKFIQNFMEEYIKFRCIQMCSIKKRKTPGSIIYTFNNLNLYIDLRKPNMILFHDTLTFASKLIFSIVADMFDKIIKTELCTILITHSLWKYVRIRVLFIRIFHNQQILPSDSSTAISHLLDNSMETPFKKLFILLSPTFIYIPDIHTKPIRQPWARYKRL